MVGIQPNDENHDNLTPLHEVLNDDQWEAQGTAWEREAQAAARTVSRYYTELTARDVPVKLASRLTRDFQADLLAMKVGQTFDGMMLFMEGDE